MGICRSLTRITLRPGSRTVVAAACALAAVAGASHAAIVPPAVRALELPEGVTSLPADDPLLAPVLTATSDTGSAVTHNLAGQTLTIGKHQVTWRETATGATTTKFIYLYPYGWQVLGPTNNLRVFEHNGARHLLHDRYGRLHAIYNDGRGVWYRLAVRLGNRLNWQPAVQVNDATTPIGMSTWGTRGQTFALRHDEGGNVVLECTWSSTWPDNRSILARRLSVDRAGAVTLSPIVDTLMTGSFHAIAVDSAGRYHLAVEYYEGISYAWSDDGTTWLGYREWPASATGCYAYRFPNLVVDGQDGVHVLWQAEGYQGYSGSRTWWVGLYAIRDPQTGEWSAPSSVLAGRPGWGPPAGGEDVLFAYPCMMIDDRQNLHLAWHGTAFSREFAWDDVFYVERPFDAGTSTWGPWTHYAVLHKRDHFGTGDGEDDHFTWVPSLAHVPGQDELYAAVMFGTGDDEVSDPNVNLTDAGLKIRQAGTWLPSFENLTQTPGLRSWYSNVAPKVMVDPNGNKWLDMIWVDGTLGDYWVLFRRIDLGGGLPGDIDGDGQVTVLDVVLVITTFGLRDSDAGFDARADLTFDGVVDVIDVIEVVTHFGSERVD